MDKISKALKKFSSKEKNSIKQILLKIQTNSISNLETKKLKGYKNIFRIRKGKIRIIYKIDSDNKIFILTIEKRSDKTYNL